MKRKSFKRSGDGSRRRQGRKTMKGALAGSLQPRQLPPMFSLRHDPPPPSSFPSFQNLLVSDSAPPEPERPPTSAQDSDVPDANHDFILSQDFFCTPDYITPDNQNIPNSVDCNKENVICPRSPEKIKTSTTKRNRQGSENFSLNPLSPFMSGVQRIDLEDDTLENDEAKIEKTVVNGTKKVHSYVPQSAVALRCRVMPPPCIKNPYLSDASETDIDPFGSRRSKCAGFFPGITGGDGLSRYRTEFHELEQIGTGNFSCVFKVLKRIDGCVYAVKHSTRQLHHEMDRRKALMEVQVLAALGSHENITGYYSSWFENEHLYIQMELCDCSLSVAKSSQSFSENEALKTLYQIAKALQFIHNKGIAHLDVKPDNIYVKNGIYKLGDFGCATLLNGTLPIEEGDARYMPLEIFNEEHDHLDKVDIFSLGAAVYELVKGSPLPDSGPQYINMRDGRLPLLPGHSMQFQNLLKIMVDPHPSQRPSAKDLLQNPIFDRVRKDEKT